MVAFGANRKLDSLNLACWRFFFRKCFRRRRRISHPATPPGSTEGLLLQLGWAAETAWSKIFKLEPLARLAAPAQGSPHLPRLAESSHGRSYWSLLLFACKVSAVVFSVSVRIEW